MGQNRDLTAAAEPPSSHRDGPPDALVADFNRDGWLDIAVQLQSWQTGSESSGAAPKASMRRRQGGVDSPMPISLETADLNRDGFQDLLVGSYYDKPAGPPRHGEPHLSGAHKRASVPGTPSGFPASHPIGMAVADWDGDGYLDVFSPHYHAELTRESLPCYLYWGGPEGSGNPKPHHPHLRFGARRPGRRFRPGRAPGPGRLLPYQGRRPPHPSPGSISTTATVSPIPGSSSCPPSGPTGWATRTWATSPIAAGSRPTSLLCFGGTQTAAGATLEYQADAPEGTGLGFELRTADTPEALQGIDVETLRGEVPRWRRPTAASSIG